MGRRCWRGCHRPQKRSATGRTSGASWRNSSRCTASACGARFDGARKPPTRAGSGVSPRFGRRVDRLPTYPMAELPAIKRRLIQQGVDVIDVGAGDADFPPPDVAVKALTRAIQDPTMSRYAFQLGLPAFREAAAGYMQRRFGLTLEDR